METACILPEHHYKDKDGYNKAKYDKRTQGVHRIIWKLCFGEIPEGLVVGHYCNNPGCLNPHHLYLTTPVENSNHAARDGLYRKGDTHPKTIRTDADCVRMYELYHNIGRTQQSIGDQYGITQSRVSECIKRGSRIVAEYNSMKEKYR